MNTHEDEGLTFADVKVLMDYVDMKLVEKSFSTGPGKKNYKSGPTQLLHQVYEEREETIR